MSKQIYEAKYKYVIMIEDEMMRKPKTKNFAVYSVSGDTYLGRIKWFAHWRQYCFFPEQECVFSKGCMNDINDFITNQMIKQKTKEASGST